jgi:hypothetical protein
MSYHTNKQTRAYIDKRVQEIIESISPIINATDCTVKELRAGLAREKVLKREIKLKDKSYFNELFEFDLST